MSQRSLAPNRELPAGRTGEFQTDLNESLAPEQSGGAVGVLERGTPESDVIESAAANAREGDQPQHNIPQQPAARRHRWPHGIDWASMAWLAVLHGGALFAPFFFTWKAIGVMLFLGWLTGGIGICLGFHRLLTHGSFKTSRPVRWLLAWIGGWAGEGPAMTWVAVHRKHHVFSDQEGDPHTPRDGAWWSHIIWLAPKRTKKEEQELHQRYVPDLVRDPVIRFLDKTFILWHFDMVAVLFAIGNYGWDAHTGWSFVIYGQFVRLVYVLHSTWLVNSATHMWGYRNYTTTDDSRNLWWVALLTYGEGWHNNHHAFQRMARHGHKWWEIDMTYWAVLTLEKLGLAWDVVHDTAAHRRATEDANCVE